MSSIDSIVFGFVAVLAVDYVGRQNFLFWGSVFQVITLVLIAVLLGVSPPKDKAYGTAAVVLLYIFYGGNAAAWLGCSWAYPAEILPLSIREKGLALGNICYWLFQFMMVEVTPIAIKRIYYRFYIILAVLNFCNAVVLYTFYPETARKSLEEIDFYFAQKYGGGGVVFEMEAGKESKGGDVVKMEDGNLEV